MVEPQRKVAEIIRADPAVAYVNSTVGVGRAESLGNSGRMLVALKPRDERGPLARGDRAAAARGQRRSRHRHLLPADPEHQSRRQARQERVPVHAAIQRHRGALSRGARIARQDGATARPARRHHRPLHQEPAGDGRRRSREGRGLRPDHRPGAPGALQRLRLAPGRDHLHAGQRLPGDPGDEAGIPAEPERPQQDLPRRPPTAPWCRCRR